MLHFGFKSVFKIIIDIDKKKYSIQYLKNL